MSTTNTSPDVRYQRILRLFIGSGLTSVVFQVLWLRIFTSVLGSTTQSVSAVVTAFMLGLGLGNLWFGRWTAKRSTHPVRMYAYLELTVFVAALVAFWLFLRLDVLYPFIHRALPVHLVKWASFAFAIVFVTIPATAMGGSLPVLATYTISESSHIRRGLGELYSANALGGAAGAALAIAMVWNAGYLAAYHVALAVNLLIAVVAFWYARTGPSEPSSPAVPEAEAPALAAPVPPEPTTSAREDAVANAVLVSFSLSGFSALCYEIIWFRLLEYFGHGTLVLFGMILALYIMGLSVGSRAMATLRIPPNAELGTYALIQVTIPVIVLVSGPLVALAFRDRMQGGAALAVVIFVVTFLSGALFPVAGKLYTGTVEGLGRNIGRLYFANTLGSVLGSLSSGFLLLPLLGTEATYRLAAAVHVVAALVVVVRFRQRFKPAVLAAGAAALVLAFGVELRERWAPRLYLNVMQAEGLSGERIIAEAESGLMAVLVTEDEDGQRSLFGGPYQSGQTDLARRQTQRLQAHIPMLLHGNPRRVLEIGFGVGEIARTILLYRPDRFDMVEIDPNMIEMAETYFDAINAKPSTHPATHVFVTDGRLHLRTTPETYDVIMSDTMILDSEASYRLYTVEHFRQARAHLAPDGVMLAWIPTNIGDEATRVLFRTFHEVFPNSVMSLPMAYNHHEAFVVGFAGEAKLDFARFEERFRSIAAPDLKLLVWDDLATFLASLRANRDGLTALSAGAAINRDMNPVLDFLKEDAGDIWETILEQHRLPLTDFVIVPPERQPAWNDLAPHIEASRRADVMYVAMWRQRESRSRAELEAALREILAAYSPHPASRLALASLLWARAADAGEGAAAEALLEEVVRMNPYHLDANLGLARAHASQGRAREARECLARARLAAPYSPIITELESKL
jgi:spermidine synthase